MIIIGEKVNATRENIKRAIETHDSRSLIEAIKSQEYTGADLIDLNVGTGSGSQEQEISDMKWLIDLAIESTGKDLCIDSADPKVFQAAAKHIHNRRDWMVNSVKGDQRSLDIMLPIVQEHKVPFIALAMDGKGVPQDVTNRLKVCERIYKEVEKSKIDRSLVYFDPLVIPMVTDTTQTMVTLECIRKIKKHFNDAKTTVGLSNLSHGLPRRSLINQAFLTVAVVNGLDSAIMDPTDPGMRKTLLVANALAGRDSSCRRLVRAYRKGLLN